jgi:hypothetical protein
VGEGDPEDLRDRADRALARARALVAILLLGLLVGLAVRVSREPEKGDTRFYVAAAGRFVAGADLYTEAGASTGYTYPPPFAAACVWTLPLPYPAVRVLWLLGMGAAAAGTLVVAERWRHAVAGLDATVRRPHLLLALALAPLLRFAVNDLAHGQVNWLVALLVAATLLAAARGRDLAAGAWLGLALTLKPTAWPLLAWLLLRRGGRRVAAGVALAGALVMAPVVLRYGPAGAAGQVLGWLAAGRRLADLSAFAPDNTALAAVLGRLLAGASPDGSSGFQRVLLALDPALVRPLARATAGALVSAAFAWLLARRRDDPRAPAALLPLAALLSPVTWKAHLVGLTPALLVAAGALAEGPAARGRWAAYGALVLLVALPARGLLDLRTLDLAGATTAGVVVLLGLVLAGPEAGPDAPQRPSESSARSARS